jgi:uncharacterized protein YcfJ
MALGVAGLVVAANAAAQVTFYERDGLRGRSFDADQPIQNFDRYGFNDRAASADVRGGRWEVCENARFEGRCVVLQPGRYNDLSTIGLKFQISSVRPLDGVADAGRYQDNRAYNVASEPNRNAGRYEERQAYAGDDRWHRRPGEDIYTADVTSVRAVMGQPGQQCWVDREQVVERRNNNQGAQVGGAVAGALIGGILGHQIGSGRGRDVATVGGAVGGAVVGSNVAGRASGGGNDVVSTQDVQHCRDVPNDNPSYYEVTYYFRGQEHRVQMSAPPGPSIAVNGNGEPRL